MSKNQIIHRNYFVSELPVPDERSIYFQRQPLSLGDLPCRPKSRLLSFLYYPHTEEGAMNMTLEQAYYVGELIAAVVVIISLIYLALQVRASNQTSLIGIDWFWAYVHNL